VTSIFGPRAPAPAATDAARGFRRNSSHVDTWRAGAVRSDPHGRVFLRCPGPLVALRAVAALYDVAPAQLAACMPVCETLAGTHDEWPAATLRTLVGDALGRRPRTPAAVHYFHAPCLVDPPQVLEHGLRPSTRGSLIRDVLLRPALYGTPDHLTVPDTAEDLAVARAPCLCIVEYRRSAAPDGRDIETALWFVAASLRGAVSARAIGGLDAHPAAIAAPDVVSVRAIGTQTEWTSEAQPR
jgi:hypothetical protein